MNFNRFGTFCNRPQSAQISIKNNKKPPIKNNIGKKKDQQQKSPSKLIQPEWNSEFQENPYKLSQAELLQRKMLAKSKNEIAGKIQLQQKMEQLQQGKLPKEYKDIVIKEKKFTSKQSFIQNEQLRKEYENRCFLSQDKIKQEQLQREGILLESQISGSNKKALHRQSSQPQRIITKTNQKDECDIKQSDIVFKATAQPIVTLKSQNQKISDFQVFMDNQTNYDNRQEEKDDQIRNYLDQKQHNDYINRFELHDFFQKPKLNDEIILMENKSKEYDYLDSFENEQKLIELKNQENKIQNVKQSFNDILPKYQEKDHQINNIQNQFRMNFNIYEDENQENIYHENVDQYNIKQQQDDLDFAFNNLNQLLEKNKNTQSSFSIKQDYQALNNYNQPQINNLLPNYKELLFGAKNKNQIQFNNINPNDESIIPQAMNFVPQPMVFQNIEIKNNESTFFQDQMLQMNFQQQNKIAFQVEQKQQEFKKIDDVRSSIDDFLGAQRVNEIEKQGKPNQIQVSGPMKIIIGQNSQTGQQKQNLPKMKDVQQNKETENEDFEKLRLMLLSTQAEIDAIL